jgi:hypothetical protein
MGTLDKKLKAANCTQPLAEVEALVAGAVVAGDMAAGGARRGVLLEECAMVWIRLAFGGRGGSVAAITPVAAPLDHFVAVIVNR